MLQHGLIHIANVVYLASYAVKDIRKLRWLTILGIVLLIPYYLAWGLWEAAVWNGAFLLINLGRLAWKPSKQSETSSCSSTAVQLDMTGSISPCQTTEGSSGLPSVYVVDTLTSS